MPIQKMLAWFGLILLGLTLTACTNVKVGTRSTAQAILSQRATILTSGELSQETQSRLLQAGLEKDTCLLNTTACLIGLKQASFVEHDKDLYGVLSELFYASALQRQYAKNCQKNQPTNEKTPTKDEPISMDLCSSAFADDMLQSVRFAYLYLMYDNLQQTNSKTLVKQTTKSLPKERDIQIQDLYIAGIDELGNNLYEKKLRKQYQVTEHQIHVTLNGKNIDDAIQEASLISSYQLNLSGLNSISRREGLGVNYVAILNNRYTTTIQNQILNRQPKHQSVGKRIYPLGHLPVTVLLIPKGKTLDEIISTHQFDLQIFDPYQFDKVSILGQNYALSANFSAPYALWLHENSLKSISYFNMLSHLAQQSEPQLFMLEPYNPNKRVIVMLHGLASSPATWIGLTNDIFNDEKLRQNYQVWQIFYPTNIPILENRYQIAELIKTAFSQVDPKKRDKASQNAVMIGHSMGGVLGRLLLSNDDLTTSLQQNLQSHQVQYFSKTPVDYQKLIQNLKADEIQQRFKMSALPQFNRAIFISAPFQGTSFADKWFTRALRRLITLPTGFVQAVSQNLNQLVGQDELLDNPLGSLFLENGASQLSDKSFFMQLTKNVIINPKVTVHTLIATDDKDLFEALRQQNLDSTLYNADNLDLAKQQAQEKQAILANMPLSAGEYLSDGIVPYKSARLDHVASEKLLAGRHSVHTSPQAILELRRILHLQLESKK